MQYLLANYNNSDDADDLATELKDIYLHILQDDSLSADLKAELLTLPSFEDLANAIEKIDVQHAENVREDWQKQLARHLHNSARQLYQKLWDNEQHSMNNSAYGTRKLRNICLRNMFLADETPTLPICDQQFNTAQTMTDQLAALNLLVMAADKEKCTQVLDTFYQNWQQDDLVIDKWFTAQAAAKVSSVLSDVHNLLHHPAFKISNPNRVRSLVGAFTQSNPRYFHALDGSGYKFLSSIVLEVDKINPQLSSRMATPFTRWQRFSSDNQKLIREELQMLAKHELSIDLREMVTKSLAK